MKQDLIRQTIHGNNGQVAGKVNNQIKNQKNIFINFDKKSFDRTLFIDTKKLFLWEKANKFSRITNRYIGSMPNYNLDEMESLIIEITELKFFYLENQKISVCIETEKLQKLKKLYDIEKNFIEKNLMIEVIKDEKIICDKIKILINLVIYDLFFLDTKNKIYIFLQILSSLCRDEYECVSFKFYNERTSILDFCYNMESASEINKQQIMENIDQKIENFKIWATIPFEYVVEFRGGIKVTLFNIFLKDEQEFLYKDFYINEKFFSADSPINILEKLYFQLINMFYYRDYGKKKYYTFFNIYNIKKISINYSKEQIELREIIKPFYNINYDICIISYIEQDQIDMMLEEDFDIKYTL